MDTHPMIERVRVAQAIADAFHGAPLDWGRIDCAQMAHQVVVGFGRSSPLEGLAYKTRKGGLRALRGLGFDTLEAAVDSMGFTRVAPALALPADILAFPTDDAAFGVALAVALSRGRCIAFVDDPEVGWRARICEAQTANFAWRTA